MNFALIISGVVDNIVVCDSQDIADEMFSSEYTVVNIDDQTVGVGWLYDGTSFTNPNAAPEPTNQELLAIALASLASGYKADVFELNMAYVAAIVNDGSAEAGKISAVRDQLNTRKAKYVADIAAARDQYPVG